MAGLRRVIWHWTGGAKGVTDDEADHYHWLYQPDGREQPGEFPLAANFGPLVEGRYAAHTRGCNTGSAGLALDAMAGAHERPFVAGPNPVTWIQIDAMLRRTAALLKGAGLPVTRATALSHAEVQPTLGIAQRGKWDIAWLPDMPAPGNPVEVGDRLRAMLRRMM